MIFLWFFVPIVFYVLDIIFLQSWAPFYFRIGIPYVRRRYHIPAPMDKQRLISRLNRALAGNLWQHGREFHQISENEIAFRGKSARFRKGSALNGLIRFIPERETVIVIIYHDLHFLIACVCYPFVMYYAVTEPFLDFSENLLIPSIVISTGMSLLSILFLFLAHGKEGKFAAKVASLTNASAKAEREAFSCRGGSTQGNLQ